MRGVGYYKKLFSGDDTTFGALERSSGEEAVLITANRDGKFSAVLNYRSGARAYWMEPLGGCILLETCKSWRVFV